MSSRASRQVRALVRAVAGVVIAALLGGISASFSIAFFEGADSLQQAIGASGEINLWTLAIAPAVAGAVCALIKIYFVKGRFCGLADTIRSARDGTVQPWKPALASVVASFVSFSSGAAVGQYGPVGHLGGLIGNWFRSWWRRGVGPACGVAAAIAAAFHAPVTGLLFAHEVILRHYSPRAFAPVTVAAVAGYTVSVALGRPPFLSIGDMQSVGAGDFVMFGVQGALFGVLSVWYLRAIFGLGKRLSPYPVLPLFIMAGAVCGLLWLLSPEASGGRVLLRAAVEGGLAHGWQDALAIGAVKAAATIICLGAGFAGGIVSPTLAIGAMSGALYAAVASALGIYEGPLFVPVVCGMIAFTAPVIGAPLAGILFVLELSGGNYPLTVAASIAVALSVSAAGKLGNGSYYQQQLQSST